MFSIALINSVMNKLEKIEREIAALDPSDLSSFRQWFASFDGESWDTQLSADAAAGRLDAFADAAIREHAVGKSKPL